MAALINRARSQIDKIVQEKGGKVVVDYTNINTPVVILCKNRHKFEKKFYELKDGQWCSSCIECLDKYSILEKVIKELDLNFDSSYMIDEVTFDYLITGDGIKCLLDIDNISNLDLDSSKRLIKRKIDLCNNKRIKIIRISDEMLGNKSLLDEFIFDSVMNDKKVCFYDDSVYNFIFDLPEEKQVDTSEIKLTHIPLEPIQEEITITHPCEKQMTIEERKEYITELLKENRGVVLAYCRVSSHYQVEDGVSLESQKAMILEYAKRRNMSVGGVFEDRGISGRTIKDRPALNEMLELVGPKIVVCVISISRLSRSVEDRIKISNIIREKKGTLVILDLDIDSSSASGSMILNVMSGMAEYESRLISERVSANMNYLSSQGRLRGKPPYGLKFVGKKVPFERVEEEQKVIEFIRKIRTENPTYSLKRICDILEKEGCPRRKAKTWRTDTLRKIMRDNMID